jgi:Uma2 family endonuclease
MLLGQLTVFEVKIMATVYVEDSEIEDYPVVPGLDNSSLPRDLLEASRRAPGPYTFDNAFDWLNDYPLELMNGWLVWDKMTDFDERTFANNIEVILDIAARMANYGQAYPDQVECQLKDGPVIKPDVCVVSNGRRIGQVKTTGRGRRKRKLLYGTPELVVELRSPSNTRDSDAFKRGQYFANGTLLVWDVDPRRRFILVWHANEPDVSQQYNEGDILTCELFPGWSRPVADFFAVGQSAEAMIGQLANRIQIRMLKVQLEARFGAENLPPDFAERLANFNNTQLEALVATAATAPTLQGWLAKL